MDYPHNRKHYRIKYPLPERPVLTIEGTDFKVVDCSEFGLRYQEPGPAVSKPGTEIRGVVRFHDGVEVEIEGEVIRVQNGQVVVHFTGSRIPFTVIIDEQRYLRTHYPFWK